MRNIIASYKVEKWNNVINEARRLEQEERYLHLVKCNEERQCKKWKKEVIEWKISLKEIYGWVPTRLSFLFNFTYSKLPTPDNLMRWKISAYNKCRCEECGN